MSRLKTIVMLVLLGFAICAAAQNDDNQQSNVPPPAFGQEAPVLNPENPPLSGLDEPGLGLKQTSRSFLSPAIQLGETADTNENNQLGYSQVQPVSFVLGALDLQRFWKKNDLFLEYLGGGAFQTEPVYEVKQLEALGLEAVTRWRTGFLQLRDNVAYVPDGSFDFGNAIGYPGLGIATGGLGTGEAGGGLPGTHFFGTGAFEAVGNVPRLSNTAIIDLVQAITPRSAFTLAGAYSNAHFYHNDEGLINGDQTTVEGGYSRIISRHDQLAGIYAFQLFRFPFNTGGEIYNQVFNLRWSHTVSGRMSFIVGAGPQYTSFQYGTTTAEWSLAGRAILRYQFQHSSLVASWEKYNSQGSGLYAGAATQSAQLAYHTPLSRTISMIAELGYTHNSPLQFSSSGIDVQSYNTGFANVIVRKHLGRTYDLFASYRFNETSFDVPFCLNQANCGETAQRHRGTVGVEWHPRPTRVE